MNTPRIDQLFQKFWDDYSQITPQARAIHHLLGQKGNEVYNDHVALRTYNQGPIALKHMAKIFLDLGYLQKGEYDFSEKKLKAFHYEHPNENVPKVFISELLVQNLSSFVQSVIAQCVNQIPRNFTITGLDLLGHRPWKPSYATYQKLYPESEYAAWVYAFGLRVNHFTVLVNRLKHPTDMAQLNELLKQNGFKLNANGGEVKGSREIYLEQSSTMAAEINWNFSDGLHTIPSCYYEFAKRYPDKSGKLYQGFVEKSADKIFESTNKS